MDAEIVSVKMMGFKLIVQDLNPWADGFMSPKYTSA